MKEVKKHVITAARFTLLVVGPASLIAGIVLLVSNNDAISIIIFFSVFAVDLLAAAHWSRRQTARVFSPFPFCLEHHFSLAVLRLPVLSDHLYKLCLSCFSTFFFPAHLYTRFGMASSHLRVHIMSSKMFYNN